MACVSQDCTTQDESRFRVQFWGVMHHVLCLACLVALSEELCFVGNGWAEDKTFKQQCLATKQREAFKTQHNTCVEDGKHQLGVATTHVSFFAMVHMTVVPFGQTRIDFGGAQCHQCNTQCLEWLQESFPSSLELCREQP